MAQNGNVWEWGESGFTAPNDLAGESRVFRGGRWFTNSFDLQSSSRSDSSPTFENFGLIGFRVASVPELSAIPEPSGVLTIVLVGMGSLLTRKRA